ncbi:PKD domain-containing protein, partial [Methanoculleus taiwanensis]|uniref:PKD domain-containing protein n=1 Tax=Methanoculleus taiwanensis TaxID=1550565 RepID=UPI0013E8BB1A
MAQWGSFGSDDGQFVRPEGICVDSKGNVYVTDTYYVADSSSIQEINNRIQKFDGSGTFITKWGSNGTGAGQFSYPRGIAADGDDMIYVVEENNHRVQKFNANGLYITQWGSEGSGDGQFERPGGIAADSAGNIYVADTHNHRVQKFDSTGAFITAWGAQGSANGQFNFPLAIAVSSDGYVYVGDENYRIQKFDANGTFITRWGSEGMGDGRFTYPPSGMAVDDSGNIFVAEGQYYTGTGLLYRIQKFDANGTFITKWGYRGTGEGGFQYPRGIAVDQNGFVFVADGWLKSQPHRIQTFALQRDDLIVNFTGEPQEGDSPLLVNFTDTSTGTPTAWSWTFGDGNTSAEQHPSNIYTSPGTYNVSLTVENAVGSNTTTKNGYITVHELIAGFIGEPREGDFPLLVNFTDTSTGSPTSWLWAFGDGGSATEQHPNYTYTAPGNYSVSLTVENAGGSNTTTEDEYIIARDWVKADFTVDTTEGVAPLTVQFTDTSTGGLAPPDAWEWTFIRFDDIEWQYTTNEQNPSYTFTIPDYYIISLHVARDNVTDIAVLSDGIRVTQAPPVASFIGNTTEGPAPLTVQFTDTSTGNVSEWNWDFGDGVTSTEQHPLKTYGIPGLYTVSLNATNDGGSSLETKTDYITVTGSPTPPLANFAGTPTTGAAPLTVQFTDLSTRGPTQWFWQFGDGTNSTAQNPKKTFTTAGTYTVSLTATNAAGGDGVTKTDYITVTTPVPPAANFTGTPRTGTAPHTVQFTDLSTGNPTAWFWQFGDGTNSTEQNPLKVYTTAGSYSISLNATNAQGSSSTVEDNYITVTDGQTPPVATFSGAPTNGTAPLVVQFTDLSTGTPTAWLWQFGDGTNSTEQNPEKIYTTPGTYTVSLNATNAQGSSSVIKDQFITVTDTPSPPAANFTGTPTAGIRQLTVQFTDLSTGNPTAWLWQFGDGTNSTEQHPQKTYTAVGTYTVSLNATNEDGSSTRTKEHFINVVDVPVPGDYTFTTQWGSRGSNDGQFVYPEGLAVDGGGTLFVVDQGNYRIQRFDGNGTFMQKWGTSGSGEGEFDVPRDIGADGEGNLYVTDTWNARIQQFDSTGSFVSEWGSYGSGDGQFTYLYGVAADTAGDVYVTDADRIQKFSRNGTFITKWGTSGSGDGQFNSAMGIAADSGGNVYVVDWGNNRVQKFDSNGTFITKWGAPGSGDGEFSGPKGIAVDDADNVYVADAKNHRIQIFAANGTYLTQIGAFGSDEGQFNEPFDVQVDSTGSVYVSDARNHRIQVFSPTIEGMPVAGFAGTPTSGETPLTVTFTDASTGDIAAWHWTFGDGTTSAEKNPTKIYTNPGTYTVSLTVTTAIGSDTEEKSNFITATPPPENYTYAGEWGSYGDGRLLAPTGTAIDNDGVIYVIDSGNNRIQKFDSNGTFITSWDGQFGAEWEEGFLQGEAYGIAVDADGFVYASTGSRIQKFTREGSFVTEWGSAGTGDGQFQDAKGIAIDDSGNVYVADFVVNRIQKFTTNGTFIGQFRFSQGSGDGEFGLGPSGIAVDADGAMYITDQINNRVQKFDGNGAFITQWGSYGTGNGMFRSPEGIQVDGTGTVYVADSMNNRIQTFSSTGTFITAWGSRGADDGNFDGPHSIAIDSTGSIYVTDFYNNRVQKFSSDSAFITAWGGEPPGDGEFYHPNGMAGDGDGAVLVADTNNHRIQKFDRNGTVITTFGERGSPTAPGEIPVDEADGKFFMPEGVAIDGDGFIYVADTGNHRIQKFDTNGTFIRKWGSYGTSDGAFDNPESIAADADGFIYVADTGNNRIQKFDRNGTFITKWGSAGISDGRFGEPRGIAVDPAGYVYVADCNNIRVQKFDSNGTFVTGWGSSGTGDGQFYRPERIASDGTGNIYVTDPGNYRVQKFTSNGVCITTWGTRGSGDGEFDVPQGICIDADGLVFVVDEYNNRVQVFSPSNPIPAPVASFTANVTGGYAPLTVRFTDTSTGSPTSWSWSFGDGATSTEQHPIHTYTTAGTYTVNLTAANGDGSNTRTQTNYI